MYIEIILQLACLPTNPAFNSDESDNPGELL